MSFQLPDWLKYEVRRKLERLGYWWESSACRKWINNNPRLVMGITCASLALLLVIVVWSLLPEKPIPVVEHEKEWFYDLNTGLLFTAKVGLTPPIDAPSGPLPNGQPAGVRAYVLAYTPEPNEAERFIAFLEIADPQPSDDTSDTPGGRRSGAREWARGKLIRRLEDKDWVKATSPQGQAIFKQAYGRDENRRRPRYYYPE